MRIVLFSADLLRLCEGKDPEDYIFSYEYNRYLKKLIEAWKLARLSPIKRKFHVLRHTRATEILKADVFNEKAMMMRFGWRTRKMIDVYSHITMEDVEQRYPSAYSPNLNTNNKELGSRLCPRCGLLLNSQFNYCPRCGQPLTLEASYEKLREAEIEEAKKLIDKLLELAQKRPGTLGPLIRTIEHNLYSVAL